MLVREISVKWKADNGSYLLVTEKQILFYVKCVIVRLLWCMNVTFNLQKAIISIDCLISWYVALEIKFRVIFCFWKLRGFDIHSLRQNRIIGIPFLPSLAVVENKIHEYAGFTTQRVLVLSYLNWAVSRTLTVLITLDPIIWTLRNKREK